MSVTNNSQKSNMSDKSKSWEVLDEFKGAIKDINKKRAKWKSVKDDVYWAEHGEGMKQKDNLNEMILNLYKSETSAQDLKGMAKILEGEIKKLKPITTIGKDNSYDPLRNKLMDTVTSGSKAVGESIPRSNYEKILSDIGTTKVDILDFANATPPQLYSLSTAFAELRKKEQVTIDDYAMMFHINGNALASITKAMEDISKRGMKKEDQPQFKSYALYAQDIIKSWYSSAPKDVEIIHDLIGKYIGEHRVMTSAGKNVQAFTDLAKVEKDLYLKVSGRSAGAEKMSLMNIAKGIKVDYVPANSDQTKTAIESIATEYKDQHEAQTKASKEFWDSHIQNFKKDLKSKNVDKDKHDSYTKLALALMGPKPVDADIKAVKKVVLDLAAYNQTGGTASDKKKLDKSIAGLKKGVEKSLSAKEKQIFDKVWNEADVTPPPPQAPIAVKANIKSESKPVSKDGVLQTLGKLLGINNSKAKAATPSGGLPKTKRGHERW